MDKTPGSLRATVRVALGPQFSEGCGEKTMKCYRDSGLFAVYKTSLLLPAHSLPSRGGKERGEDRFTPALALKCFTKGQAHNRCSINNDYSGRARCRQPDRSGFSSASQTDCALPLENQGESVSAATRCPRGCCSHVPWSILPQSVEENEQQQPIGRAWLCPPCCPQPPPFDFLGSRRRILMIRLNSKCKFHLLWLML